MRRYIEFYDINGNELMGSDSILPFDNRLSNQTAIACAINKLKGQMAASLQDSKYIKPKAYYLAVVRGDSLLSIKPLTPKIKINY